MTRKLAWGILGPGSIACRFAEQLGESERGRLVAVASRDGARARAFADEFGAESSFGDYQELLASPAVDAVYIATVHTEHAAWAIRAAEAGKHVLCEKPLSTNAAFTMSVIEAARRNEVALLEGFMYRFHPQTERVLELVRDGAVGRVTQVEASFSFNTSADDGRLLDPRLAGGGILDVGGYPVSLARAVVIAAGGSPEPTSFAAAGTLGDTGVDVWTTANVGFGDISAHLTAGIKVDDEHRVRIVGTAGVITVPAPWVPAPERSSEILLSRLGAPSETIVIPSAHAYALEADALAAAASGSGQTAELPWAESQGIADLTQRWREAIGVQFPFERPDASMPPVHGGPLRTGQGTMTYGRVPGIAKEVSRLVMGVDNQRTLAHASVMFDDYAERGGNTFDTAFEYGDGVMETLLGQWMRTRGVREQMVVIAKGAHTPNCNPEAVTSELTTSLARLQTEYADLYFLHRDNPDIPVGEFVDVLDEHVRAGRIGAFGGSNWSIERIDEANAYAVAHGKHGFTLLSNHFGLARAYDLPWPGCRHATDPESKAWLERTQTPLFPWSSQARGFFSRADPEDRTDPQLVRCYYGDDNFERLRRARELGERRGVRATAIALAYVLHQPFPTFPLFGPRTLTETRTSMEALRIELSPEEVRWLDLRDADEAAA